MIRADQPDRSLAEAPGRPRRRGPGPVLLLVCAAAALGACTTVRVSDAAGISTKYYPGLAVVRIAPAESMQVVEVQALGPSVVGDQASLGWIHSRIALVPPDRCQLLLWRADAAAMAELRDRIGPETELCTQEGE